MWYRSAVAFGMLAAVACSRAGSLHRPPSRESLVYATLFDTLSKHRWLDTVVVAERTAIFKMADILAAGNSFEAIQLRPLAERLTRLSERPLRTSDLPLPRPRRTVTDAELKEIFEGRRVEGWAEFYRRYPRQRGWFRFSPVAFSAVGESALVYFEFLCGWLCAEGTVAWIDQPVRGGPWVVRKLITLWVS